jgi:3-phenylpropionate/trans-cinnamate dioxygenase ferredoxin reductase subunit
MGFVTDSWCRTSVPGIYAIGDRAYNEELGGHHRSEHWTNATVQARIAAADIVGAPHRPASTPYFWSGQYGRMLQFVGHCRATDAVGFLDGDASTRYHKHIVWLTPSAICISRRIRVRNRAWRGRP